MNKFQLLIFFFLSFFELNAQQNIVQSMTLEDCIRIAVENDINLKDASLVSETSKVNVYQSKMDALPSLDFNYNIGQTNGRSIDPFSNDYVNESLQFSYTGLSLDAVIFNGFRQKNLIKQNELNLAASEMRKQEIKDNLILNVTRTYLQVLNDKDLIELAKSNTSTTEKQLQRLKTIHDQESGNPAQYYDMQGQLNNDQLNVSGLENQLKASLLDLATLLNMNPDQLTDIQSIDRNQIPAPYSISASEVYREAIQNLAMIQTKKLERESTSIGMDVAKAGRFPIISLFGGINSNYSSAAQLFTETGAIENATGAFVRIDNNEVPVLAQKTLFDANRIGYFNQISNNLNSSFGIAIRVPIFSGFQVKNNLALQKIETSRRDVEMEDIQRQLRQAIENAYISLTNTHERYQILSKQIVAFEESFRINEIRFNKGVSNVVEYLNSKNSLENVRLNLVRIKHEYELRVKVLEYYRGL